MAFDTNILRLYLAADSRLLSLGIWNWMSWFKITLSGKCTYVATQKLKKDSHTFSFVSPCGNMAVLNFVLRFTTCRIDLIFIISVLISRLNVQFSLGMEARHRLGSLKRRWNVSQVSQNFLSCSWSFGVASLSTLCERGSKVCLCESERSTCTLFALHFWYSTKKGLVTHKNEQAWM